MKCEGCNRSVGVKNNGIIDDIANFYSLMLSPATYQFIKTVSCNIDSCGCFRIKVRFQRLDILYSVPPK